LQLDSQGACGGGWLAAIFFYFYLAIFIFLIFLFSENRVLGAGHGVTYP
jgi:hypothetical protein